MTWLPVLHLLLDSNVRRPVTEQALELVTSLFGTPDADGIAMAARAARAAEDPATIAGSLVALVMSSGQRWKPRRAEQARYGRA